MLTFNQLLRTADLDPAAVRLARHNGSTPAQRRQMRDAAYGLDVAFQRYQERQGKEQVIQQFRSARYLAGFLAEPGTRATVFVGLWELKGERKERLGDPLSVNTPLDAPYIVEFDSTRLMKFDPYVGRLVIDWGDGMRAWVQRADKQEKPIIELRRERADPEFIGFTRFKWVLGEVESLYSSWVEILRYARGVYMVVRRDTGEQYVGSAYGADGFYGRWCGYADGHGGNAALKELKAPASAFDVSILEVVGSAATVEEIIDREGLWKEKLGTRTKGLNRN